MDLISKIFEMKRNIQLQRIGSRLQLPPTSETGTLIAIKELTQAQDQPGIRVSELAGLLCVSVPTVSRCLQKLADKGYVQKTLNEKDKRGTYVTLTEEGDAMCGQVRTAINAFLLRVQARLEPAELEQFLSTLDKIYDAIRAELPQESRSPATPPKGNPLI